jgi:hypothetical protein
MMFQKKILPPSSGSKRKPSKSKQQEETDSAWFLLGFVFDLEGGGSKFLQKS